MRRSLLAVAITGAMVVASCSGGSDAPAQTTVPSSAAGTAPAATAETVTGDTPAGTTGATQPIAVEGGEIVVALSGPLDVWDENATIGNETAGWLMPMVYGPYMRFTTDLTGVVPDIIESATPSDDFTTWTLVVRPGLNFSDGAPLTSADVVFSLQRIARNPSFAYTLGSPAETEIVATDDRTVTITLSAPDSELPELGLTAFSTPLVPVDYGGRTEAEYFQRPIGAGPFMIESTSPDEIVLTRNDRYWDAANVALERVTVKVVPDINARLLGFESGDYDVISRVPVTNAKRADDAGDVIIVDPSAVVDLIFLNGAKAPFDDVHFRKAVWYGIDRDLIAKGVYDGLARVAQGLIPSAHPYATPGEDPPSFDPDRAREELAMSEHASEASFELLISDADAVRRDEAQVIVNQLADVGIKVTLKTVPATELLGILIAGEHQAAMAGNESVVGPASDVIGFFGGTSGFFGGYDTGEAFALFVELQSIDVPTAKVDVLARFETLFAEQAYHVPTVEPFWVVAHAPRVIGMTIPPILFPYLDDVSVAG